MGNWHSIGIDDVLKKVKSTEKGLSSWEAARRLERSGANELKRGKRTTPLQIFLSQFNDFLIAILIVAAIVSGVIGVVQEGESEIIESLAIVVIVIFIAVVGFIQEYRAEKELEALKKMVSPHAVVIREGKVEKVEAKWLVPGDIILLDAGYKVPGDARVMEAINLKVDESPLTGESVPAGKSVSAVEDNAALGDRKNMVFMGTSIAYGRGKAVIVNTGMKTEFGKIAGEIQKIEKEQTPLQKRLDVVGKKIGAIVLVLCAAIFFFGIWGGIDPFIMFLAAVALAVAAVPEGLPAVVTVTLARGMRKMTHRNAIVRRLTAVETLGCTSIICSDKTGTLTRDEMTVRKIYANNKIIKVGGEGYKPEGEFSHEGKSFDPGELESLLKICVLCNNASLENVNGEWKIIGDPTEGSLLVLGEKAGVKQKELEGEYPRIGEIPFTSERKGMTTVHKIGDEKFAYVKGAPDVVLGLCASIYENGRERAISRMDGVKITAVNERFAGGALRVIGAAYKRLSPDEEITEDAEKDLVFVGLVGMIDPPREDAKIAVKKCREAGIKSVMITGDHKLTGMAIAREMNMFKEGDLVLTGAELDEMGDRLNDVAENVRVYARVSPEHKLRIVKALKEKGHVIAMTGDGVNDAPALKKSDIGVAMGITGTDVTKEAADMVLEDDNFASIVSAVEEGRSIYDNIRLFIRYLLSCNIGEVLTVFMAMMSLAKLPLLPLQILWMNFLTDAAPALALGFNTPDPDVMKKKPRDPREGIITRKTLSSFIFIGALMGLGTLLLFNHTLQADESKAQTMAFTTLVMFQMFYVLSCRSEKYTLFKVGVFSNKYLIIAVLFSISLQLMVVYMPLLQGVFNTVPLEIGDWLKILVVSSTGFLIPEALKLRKQD